MHGLNKGKLRKAGWQIYHKLILNGSCLEQPHEHRRRAVPECSSFQVAPSSELLLHANQVIDAWSVLGLHPNLSVPRLAFITGEIGGRPSLYLAYDFYAAAITLEAAHMQPQVTPNGLVQVGP